MSVLNFYVCPHLLSCVSLYPSIMPVPAYYVCPHLFCLSPPIMSVPTYYHARLHSGFSAKLRICQASAGKMEPRSGIISGKNPTYPPTCQLSLEGFDLSICWSSTNLNNILIWPTQLGFRVWHSQLSLFIFISLFQIVQLFLNFIYSSVDF